MKGVRCDVRELPPQSPERAARSGATRAAPAFHAVGCTSRNAPCGAAATRRGRCFDAKGALPRREGGALRRKRAAAAKSRESRRTCLRLTNQTPGSHKWLPGVFAKVSSPLTYGRAPKCETWSAHYAGRFSLQGKAQYAPASVARFPAGAPDVRCKIYETTSPAQ